MGDIVQTLLESGQLDVNATYDTVAGHRCRDDCGGTALHKLLGSGGGWDAENRLTCLKLLLDNKANPNLVSLGIFLLLFGRPILTHDMIDSLCFRRGL